MSKNWELLHQDNFRLAFYRLKTAQRNLYKDLYRDDMRVFEAFLNDNINCLISDIQQGIYAPKKCHKIFIPKKNKLVRPLSLLHFTDLLVYQALVNVIAENAFDIMRVSYSKILFGNIVNTVKEKEEDRKFFYKPWKTQWRKYNDKSKSYFNSGYKYLSEFDIASFYDTIDHGILMSMLKDTFSVSEDVIILLKSCLGEWTLDSNRQKSFRIAHGIPQGPLSSAFLADLYLYYVDREITNLNSLDIKYLRYVDDIRIFSRDKKTSEKAIAALDLFSRELGLIPQSSKIEVNEITNIDEVLKARNIKFSAIVKEYKKDNKGKKAKSLKSKTHKQLKKRFLDCFNENDTTRKENFLDKTIISFSLFKLNKDEEIRDLLFEKYQMLYTNFEGILFYLKEHFSEDLETLGFLNTLIRDEDMLFHHITALVFKFFPTLDFDLEVYKRFFTSQSRYWLVQYFMVSWLEENKKRDILINLSSENYFVQRALNSAIFRMSDDNAFKEMLSEKLLSEKDESLALQGMNLKFHTDFIFKVFPNPIELKSGYNRYIKYILDQQQSDFISHVLANDYGIANPDNFFGSVVWGDTDEYNELVSFFFKYEKYRKIEPSLAIISLNSFNNLVYNNICRKISSVSLREGADYGANLGNNILDDYLPICNMYWAEINSMRNQKSEAHPHDKYGNLRVQITKSELGQLHENQIEALKEVCKYQFL